MVVPILSVEFSVVANTNWGQNLFVVGSIPQLGNWDPSKAVRDTTANNILGLTDTADIDQNGRR